MDGFLYQASLYLLVMVIAVPLSQRLGLGSVLGYLGAGILIGPVLGLTGTEMNDLQHFAEFGVVMMLFLIGLELEPRTLWKMRDKLIGLGGLQVVLTMALVIALAMALGQDLRVAIALGMIFSLSSTAIVLQTLDEKKLMSSGGGRSAFSVLLMQDIAVIPMLALMPLLASPGARALAKSSPETAAGRLIESLPGWGVTLVTIGAVVGVVLAGHYVFKPAFRFVHTAKLREVNTALALAIVVGIAFLMTLVGLSPALGTFLAGVVLADSEFRHELESDIAPFKGLLLGLFFITVGAGMNFATFTQEPVLVVGMVITLVGLKAGVLYGLAHLFKLKPRDRVLFTLSLAQAGEFGFVLISFASAQYILPTHLAEVVLLVTALSMLITPLLFLLHDAITRRLRDDVKEEADEIDDQQPIIIAGVGRFGQVVNRMVNMSGFKTTVLDADLATIQLMRKFGFKGYYGDPTRPDLLAAAGLDKAIVLVVCLDDKASTNRLVAYARRMRPDLHIIARARDRFHVFDLYAAGADDIIREMFDSSLRAARYVLENVGLTEFEAAEVEKMFFKMDRAGVRELAAVWKPGVPVDQNPEYLNLSRKLYNDMADKIRDRDGDSAQNDSKDG